MTSEGFGNVLRQLRRNCGLTQEELAERSGLSVDAISALERGHRRSPRRDTVALLAEGLSLGHDQTQRLSDAVERSGSVPRRAHLPTSPRQLPAPPGVLIGRDHHVLRLLDLLGPRSGRQAPAMVAITGMGGIGKTSLAVHAANLLAEEYPDGQLYLDLRGVGATPMPSLRALTFLIGSLGVDSSEVSTDLDEASAQFRSALAEARLLIVLDNAEDLRQIEPLLPGSAACGVIITSRRAICGHPDIEQISLETLSPGDSMTLLEKVLGAARADGGQDALADIAGACAGLPLALRIAGSRILTRPGWPVEYFAGRLRDAQTRLGELCAGESAVRSNLAMSIEALESSPCEHDRLAARLHRLAGILPATSFSVAAMSHLADLDEATTSDALERLADVSLIESVSPYQYAMHDLVHAVAIERAGTALDDEERLRAMNRILDFYTALAWRTRGMSRPAPTEVSVEELTRAASDRWDDATCLRILDGDSEQVIALCALSLDENWPHRWRIPILAQGLITLFVTRMTSTGWEDVLQWAKGCVGEEGDALGDLRRLEDDLALACIGSSNNQNALAHAGRARELSCAAGDLVGEASAIGSMAVALGRMDRIDEAIALRREGLAICQRLGDARAEAAAYRDLGALHARRGERPEGIEWTRLALASYRELGVARGVGMAAVNLGVMLRDSGHFEEALPYLEESATIFHGCDDRAGEAEALDELGFWYVLNGNPDEGVQILSHGLTLDQAPSTAQWEARIRQRLSAAIEQLGREEADESNRLAIMRIDEVRRDFCALRDVSTGRALSAS